ncbi:MAG: hypothetical protein HC909_02430 [Blastochloris sp.]|nr:hypothetical protein [Blastochloris sp.]
MTVVAKSSFPALVSQEVVDEVVLFRQRLKKLIASGHHITMTIRPLVEAPVMLEHNTGNRSVMIATIRRYAADMKAGRWLNSGEPIIFSRSGILNDGQHRLMACVEAGVPFLSDVRFGIDRAAFAVTNSHNKRRPGDVLSILGEKSPRSLAAALNWVYRYERGLPGSLSHYVTNSDVEFHLQRHPEIRRSCDIGQRLNSATRFISPAVSSALHYIFARRDRAAADAFFEFLLDGVGATRHKDPRVILRKKLTENLSATAKLSDVYLMAVTIKAWNGHRAGRDVDKIYWVVGKDKDGKSTPQEAFPEAV